MKKILSVALSTAMAFSMFATVASANTAATPQQAFDALQAKGILQGFPDGQAHLDKDLTRAEFAIIIAKLADLEGVAGTSFRDANYANHWAKAEIEAVYKAGFMQGVGANLFQPSAKVTLQEVATVVSRILKLETPTAVNNNAALWAQGYVQSVINAGLINPAGLDFTAAANRGTVVSLVYAVDQVQSIPTLSNAVVVDASTLTVTLSDGTTHQVKLATPLVANTATNVTFEINGQSYTTSVTYVVTAASKVESVSASNLKEVVVTFDGEVEAATAEDAINYTFNRDIRTKSASLSADKKTVTLTIEKAGETEGRMQNQTEYQLTVSNVRAGSTVINATNIKFTPVDAALPVAQTAEALGNRAIKVTFSEPVLPSSITANNFKLNGSAVVGTVDVTGRVVVLKVNNTLTTGQHTVNVSGIRDYSNLANLSTDLTINVVADTTAPTVAVEKATFEEVTLKFSEAVDKQTVNPGNIYWQEGTARRYATSVEAISDDTYKVLFTATNVLRYPTALYVSNVSDYSGNVIATGTNVQVTPVVDQTRPEVISVKFLEKSSTVFDVRFTKTLDNDSVIKAENYIIKDSAGKVVAQYKQPVLQPDRKTVRVTLFSKLDANKDYTLEVVNVSDSTTLKNVMLPYTTTIRVGDITEPKVTSVTTTSTANRLVVNYDKVMATSGDGNIADSARYLYYHKEDTATGGALQNGQWRSLPSGTQLTISSDAKSAIIIFPSDFVLARATAIRVTGVKDVAGNNLSGLVADTAVDNDGYQVVMNSAKATDRKTIEVQFSQPIQSGSATPNDFVVTAGTQAPLTIVNATVDGSKVKLTLAEELNANATFGTDPVEVTVMAGRSIVSPAGSKVDAEYKTTVADGIKPTLIALGAMNDGLARLTFNEVVNATEGTNAEFDFEVRANGDLLNVGTDFRVIQATPSSYVDIQLLPDALDKYTEGSDVRTFSVTIRSNPQFLKDTSSNNNVVNSGSEPSSLFTQIK